MKKEQNKQNKLAATLLLAAGIAVFTACASMGENNLPHDTLSQDIPPQNASPAHSVPYFHDDNGKLIQIADGYLYGYWNGLLCRYDLETLEPYEYFKAASNQSGQFCIYGDYIYFLEKSHTSSLTEADTNLYRVKLDSQNPELLAAQIPNASSSNIYDDRHYQIDIYDGIIYLINQYGSENIYYRLDETSGLVTRIDEAETIYGMLPYGYYAPPWYWNLPSLPYQMRHYGYLFLWNDWKLAVYDVKEGILEPIDFEGREVSLSSMFVTNDALYYAEQPGYWQTFTRWHRISLDDLQHTEDWVLSPVISSENSIFYDENGAYFVDDSALGASTYLNVYRAAWDKTEAELLYSQRLQAIEDFPKPFSFSSHLYGIDGEHLYYADKIHSTSCVLRSMLTSDSQEPETVMVYHEDKTEDICRYETWEHSYTISLELNGEAYALPHYTSLTQVFLTEDTNGAHAINAYLDKVYADAKLQLESFGKDYDPEGYYYPMPGGLGSYRSISALVHYLDDDYIGIRISDESYSSGGTHPNTWSEEYVFDRSTGQRISITDMVENTPEEIRDIVAAYIEYPLTLTDEKRESIPEDFRFFLSQEGIGIHFNTYEIGSYASGICDYIIPFSEFDLKGK